MVVASRAGRDAFPPFLVLFVLAVLADSFSLGYPGEVLSVCVGLFVVGAGVRFFGARLFGDAAHRPVFLRASCAVAAF